MVSDEIMQEATEATVAFERDLKSLVLAAFAEGAAVEGAWEVEVPISPAPNWCIEIEKTYADGGSTYDPEFIDE